MIPAAYITDWATRSVGPPSSRPSRLIALVLAVDDLLVIHAKPLRPIFTRYSPIRRTENRHEQESTKHHSNRTSPDGCRD